MRFDDKLATVLAQPRDTAAARAAAWRQLVDIVAQRPAGEPLPDAAARLIRTLRDQVPAAVRAEAARAIAGRALPAEVVALIAEEPAAVAAPVLGSARLASDAWLSILPRMGPVARSLVRGRRDLAPEVARGLAGFGAADFALPAAEIAEAELRPLDPVEEPDGETQIRELLSRIAAYRRDGVAPAPAEEAPASDFRFETGPDGVILWVEGAPRGPLIGETIAIAAERADHGVDGQAAGAFRRRAAFRDARLSVAGAGPVAGEWRISAVPFFDHRDGRFTGYRGTARRPHAGDRAVSPAAAEPAGLHGSGIPADSLRQLVHELRTPLNAIVGFAEMIDRQMLGPAAASYRDRAREIIADGRRLLAGVDDLDMAARVETQRLAHTPAPVDAAALLARLQGDFAAVEAARGARLAVSVAPGLRAIDGDPVAVERMFARLLAATIGLAREGETIAVALTSEGGVTLSVARPRLLAGRDERTLLDPGYSPDGDWPDAPLLGLGFALRLIRNLANAGRGSLEIGDDHFVLRLPAEAASAAGEQRN